MSSLLERHVVRTGVKDFKNSDLVVTKRRNTLLNPRAIDQQSGSIFDINCCESLKEKKPPSMKFKILGREVEIEESDGEEKIEIYKVIRETDPKKMSSSSLAHLGDTYSRPFIEKQNKVTSVCSEHIRLRKLSLSHSKMTVNEVSAAPWDEKDNKILHSTCKSMETTRTRRNQSASVVPPHNKSDKKNLLRKLGAAQTLFNIDKRKPSFEQTLTASEMLRLYLAKCKDMNITPLEQPYHRFVAYCEVMCVNRKLNFREFRVGQHFVCELSSILKVKQNISQLVLSGNNLRDGVLPSLCEAI